MSDKVRLNVDKIIFNSVMVDLKHALIPKVDYNVDQLSMADSAICAMVDKMRRLGFALEKALGEELTK